MVPASLDLSAVQPQTQLCSCFCWVGISAEVEPDLGREGRGSQQHVVGPSHGPQESGPDVAPSAEPLCVRELLDGD